MIEARDDKRLLRLQDQLAKVNLLIVDDLGYAPLSQTRSELLFEVFSRRRCIGLKDQRNQGRCRRSQRSIR